ncbi:MAG: spore coat protein [candidate division Zixibacteria bacterium SM23_73_2]|nr:MAG: spore coat protein [candidate division Zixibacteria bacterium SM23_73_2]
MKGLILAGGLGTRLFPLTKITNKHLLPVYDRPMIFYPLQTLINAGIKDIMVVTGGNNAGDFLRLLGNGKEFGLKHLNYTYQEREGGIAEALGLAEHFAEGERVVVILGDNIIEWNIVEAVKEFKRQRSGAKIMIKTVKNPKDYGVAELKGNKIVKIVEKPQKPKSNYAVLGIYMYDNQVFDIIKTLKPSKRGELEITDVNNAYIKRGDLTYSVLKGYWADAGASIDALLEANKFVARHGANKKI